MKKDLPAIPYRISEYIQEHFKEDFLFEVKEVKNIKGQLFYPVEVTKDDYLHRLLFNEAGLLVNEEVEQAFPPDIHEEQYTGDLPDE